MTTWLVLTGLAVLLIVIFGVVSWAYQTATRLDRLHVRCDMSWQALDGALARRAVVARAMAIDAYGRTAPGRRLAALADMAETAPRATREVAENALSAELATIDPDMLPAGLVAELADAESRVLLARRFHNDAVRDTLVQRDRPMVRALRLGGTASRPSYFEIVERPHTVTGGYQGDPCRRTSARVVLLDETGTVLLLHGRDPMDTLHPREVLPTWWFTVGGEVEAGEPLAAAAVRELAEETGLLVATDELVGPLWRRAEVFAFNGAIIDSEEFFFVHRTRRFKPSTSGRTELENRYIHGHRWCSASAIAELIAAGQKVYPLELADRLAEACAAADRGAIGGPESVRSIH